MTYTICDFNDFCTALLQCGFSMGGGNDHGVFALIPFNWENQAEFNSPLCWHTGKPETDPWLWRMRVLAERDDIAYAKVFFGSSGYITKDWYPLFWSVRRRGETFDECYESGVIGAVEKQIYEALVQHGALPLHELKRVCGVHKETAAKFERALVSLQTRMFITMCGAAQKTNALGVGYGWNSTVFTTVESFWRTRGVTLDYMDADEAYQRLFARVCELNPQAVPKKIEKFIRG